jgi:NAD(P)-dependent dehydrogenase (short-subunit alcohol dehydrogenase family)
VGIYALTGGATGIGAAIKSQLLEQGHTVIVVDIKSADIEADLSSTAGRTAAIEALNSKAASGLDGFIACAGVASHVPNKALIASVNYFGTVDLVAGVKDLLAAKKGSVILISSNSAPMQTSSEYVELLLAGDEAGAGKVADAIEGQAVYSGSKQAVARWMRRNTADYARAGIRMNAIAPGYTQTPMTEAVAKDPNYSDAIKQFMDSIPVGRPGKPEDMANMVSFLLSPAASFVCGSVIFVDGGHDAMLRPDNF